jgi:hypothetical protein
MKLMRIDSAIALDVLYHFATIRTPCLGCHDSFVVPSHAASELREAMHSIYQKHVHFLPVVKLARGGCSRFCIVNYAARRGETSVVA